MMNTPNSAGQENLSDLSSPVLAYPDTPMSEATTVGSNSSASTTQPAKKNPFLIIGVIAIFVIVGLGALFALNSKPTTTPVSVAPQPMASQPTQVPLFLSLDAVEEGAVVGAAGEVLIAGSTLPQSAVVIFSDQDEMTFTSDDQGQFEETVMVDPEGGEVTVVVFSDNGDEVTQIIQVTPETGVLGKTDEKPTQAQNNARNIDKTVKVQNKSLIGDPATTSSADELEPTNLSPTPSVTTTAEETKRIREFVQEKNQVKINLKMGKEKMRELAEANSTGVSEGTPSGQMAKKAPDAPSTQVYQVQVVPVSPSMVQKRRAISGIITQLNETTIVIAHPNQRERTYVLYINPATVVKSRDSIIPTADLAVGNRVVAVGESVTGGLLASRVHVIPGLATGLMQRQPVTQTTPVSTSPTPLISPTLTGAPIPTVTTSPSPTGVATPTPATPTPTRVVADPTVTPNPEAQL